MQLIYFKNFVFCIVFSSQFVDIVLIFYIYTVFSLFYDVDLWYVQDAVVFLLFGGMQRRFCVVLVFVGDFKAVILDELISGVDFSGRRGIWNFFVKYKMSEYKVYIYFYLWVRVYIY